MNFDNKDVSEVSLVVSNNFKITESESLIPNDAFKTLEQFKAYLTKKLTYLLDNKYNTLLNVLYRIDVNEEKLHQLFAMKNKKNIPAALADLIIERSIQKIKLRKEYRDGNL